MSDDRNQVNANSDRIGILEEKFCNLPELQAENKKLEEQVCNLKAAIEKLSHVAMQEAAGIIAQNEKLKEAVQEIFDHEEGCRSRGIGFDDLVHARCERLLLAFPR